MKRVLIPILLGLATAAAQADTPLTIGSVAPGPGGPCYDDTLLVQDPPVAAGTFTLSGVTGTGIVNSTVRFVINNATSKSWVRYDYSVDMSGMSSSANHCLRLLVHFGTPHTCSYDVLVFTGSGGTATPASATKAPYGDVTFVFNSGCLSPPQTTLTFGMLSDAQPKTNVVTIIDDYTDPASGLTNETRINVTAIVPDVPPDWAFAPPHFPIFVFQGFLDNSTNEIPMKTNTGPFDFTLQLFDGLSNGLPVGPVFTQTVQVVKGLFTMPLPFDPAAINWGDRWLGIGVRPTGGNGGFTRLGNLPITPAPQALYAYSAGVVADVLPSQAVTSMNGITGNLVLAGGSGIQVTLNGDGKTLVISQANQSDRNLKTGFSVVKPEEILAKLVALPIQNWRFTNEVATIHHLGPMAQDFKAAFGLGSGDTTIGTVDESGVALSAIQGLNQKLEDRLKMKDAEIESLKSRLEKLEQAVEQQNVNH